MPTLKTEELLRRKDGSLINPRDHKVDAIIRRLDDDAEDNSGAWFYFKHSVRQLRGATRKLIGLWQCRLFWHASRPITQMDTKNENIIIKVCRRCGAWRGDY